MKIMKLFGALLVLVIALAGCSAQDQIVIYSNSLSDGRGEWLTDKAAEEGFNIKLVDLGAGDIYNRLLAEANAPIADIVFGLDDMMFQELNNEDLLYKYSPEWTSEIDQGLIDVTDGYYAPTVEQRIVMVYNPEYYTPETAPQSWQDLSTNPEFADKYFAPDSTGGGTKQKVFITILNQYQDPNGDLGISDEGWDMVAQYLSNSYQTPSSEDQWQNFKDGVTPIGYTFSSGIQGYEETYDIQIEPVNPPEGVISMNEQIGIVNKGDKDYSQEEEFVEWFGSAEVQGEWAQEFNSMPLNQSANESETEAIKEISDKTTPMEIDWSFVNDNLDAWMEKIELEIIE